MVFDKCPFNNSRQCFRKVAELLVRLNCEASHWLRTSVTNSYPVKIAMVPYNVVLYHMLRDLRNTSSVSQSCTVCCLLSIGLDGDVLGPRLVLSYLQVTRLKSQGWNSSSLTCIRLNKESVWKLVLDAMLQPSELWWSFPPACSPWPPWTCLKQRRIKAACGGWDREVGGAAVTELGEVPVKHSNWFSKLCISAHTLPRK